MADQPDLTNLSNEELAAMAADLGLSISPQNAPQPVEGRQEAVAITDESVSIPAELMAGDEIPPEPPLVVQRNKFGPGAHGVYFPDGTPVGVWMRENNCTPQFVQQYLTERGLDADLVTKFSHERSEGIEADRLLNLEPAVQQNQVMLDKHDAQTEALRAAFIKAKKEKT